MRRVGWRIADLRGSRLSSLARFARQQVCGFDARVWPTCGVNLLDWARISPEVEVVAGCVVSLIALAASNRAPSAVDELWNPLNDLPKSPIFVEVWSHFSVFMKFSALAGHGRRMRTARPPPLQDAGRSPHGDLRIIEGWYNPHRRPPALDYHSPINYERFIQRTI